MTAQGWKRVVERWFLWAVFALFRLTEEHDANPCGAQHCDQCAEERRRTRERRAPK